MGGSREVASPLVEDAQRSDEGVSFKRQGFERAQGHLLLDSRRRDNREADVYLHGVFERCNMVEFHHHVGTHPVFSEEAVDGPAGGRFGCEENQRMVLKIFGGNGLLFCQGI